MSHESDTHVSASRVAALFGVSPYWTLWLLYQRHARGMRPPVQEDERMEWGRRLEPVILEATAERLALDVVRHPQDQYTVDPAGAPLGCLTDAHVECPSRGRGVVEAKSIDWLVWRDEWDQGKTVPQHIALQLQCEMLCEQARWAVLAVLVGGNALHLIEQAPVAEVHEEMRARARAFQARVAAGDEPDPLGTPREWPLLRVLWPEPVAETVRHVGADPEADDFDVLCATYFGATKDRRAAQETELAAKTALIQMAGEDEVLLSDLWRFKWSNSGRGIRITVSER